jgi:rfaE bifunctional protein kinase chain/domain
MDLASFLPKLSGARILVLGDIMLDHYVWGEVERISPEAPIPVLRIREKTSVLGGAGNVAANLAGLGCRVMLAGIHGDDSTGKTLAAMVREVEIDNLLVIDQSRPTTIKTRMMAQRQQLLRIDEEDKHPLDRQVSVRLFENIKGAVEKCNAVILSDYGKGVLLREDFVREVISLGRAFGLPVLVDPKGRDWQRYRYASCVTPNAAELEAVIGSSCAANGDLLAKNSDNIRKRYDLNWLLVTRGPKGMCLVGPDDAPTFLDACAQEVFDVSGAGDTVIATLAAGMGAGMPIQDAAKLANIAAGIVVGKLGTQPVTMPELKAAVGTNGNAVKSQNPGSLHLLIHTR